MQEVTLAFDFYDFPDEFVWEMDWVLRCYDLVGYRENWSFDFPVGLYLRLKNIYKGYSKLAISEITAEQHFGADATVSDFNRELELLREV